MRKFRVITISLSMMLLVIATQALAVPYVSLFDPLNFSGTLNRSTASDTWDNTYKGYTGSLYSGYYIGTFTGNDSNQAALVQNAINTYLSETLNINTWYKAEADDWTDGPLTVTLNTGGFTGTWALNSPYAIGFYIVKGGTEFALYYVHPYQSSGVWSTEHILNNGGNQPDISHLSAAASSVPEPATVLLLGLSLLGVAGYSRRKFKS